MKFKKFPGGFLYEVQPLQNFVPMTLRKVDLQKTIGLLVGRPLNSTLLEVYGVCFHSSGKTPEQAKRWLQKNLAFQKDLLEKAISGEMLPAQVLNITEGEQKLLALIAFQALDAGESNQAKSIFQALLALNKTSNLAHTGLGNVLLAEGKNDEALASFKRALKWYANDVEALLGIALIFLDRGETKRALPPLLQILYIDQVGLEQSGNIAQELIEQYYSNEELLAYLEANRDKVSSVGGARPVRARGGRIGPAHGMTPQMAGMSRAGPLNLRGAGPMRA